MKIPKGHPGSWFAEWQGEQLPCVHTHATKGRWPNYLDGALDDRGEWPEFVRAIREDLTVLLTTSHPPDAQGKRRRKSYSAVWRVADVTTDYNQLRFRFAELLHRF